MTGKKKERQPAEQKKNEFFPIPEDITEYDVARLIIAKNETPFLNYRNGQGVITYTYRNGLYDEDKNFKLMNTVADCINLMIQGQKNRVANSDDYEEDAERLEDLLAFRGYSKMSNVERFVSKMTTSEEKDFDKDLRYLNVQNGVYDLQDHVKLDHDPRFHFTKMMPFEYDENAVCPEFLKLLNHMFPDPETRVYFLELLASSLMRKRFDEKIFFLWGKLANNGKTTIIQAILRVLGLDKRGYGWWLDSKVFSTSRSKNSTQPELYETMDRCLAPIDEPDTTEEADESLLKNISNTKQISLRTLYQGAEAFNWTATVICLCNKLPIIDMKNAGAMRRPIVIPVETRITEEMKKAPRVYEMGATEKFGDYLAINEAPGIFNLLIRALKNYQARGYRLPEPGQAIRKATEDYIRKNNTVKQFVDLYCRIGEDPATNDAYYCNGKEFFDAYEKYCKDDLKQKNVMQKNNIAEVMEAMGFPYGIICDRRTSRVSVRGFDGLRLATPVELAIVEQIAGEQSNPEDPRSPAPQAPPTSPQPPSGSTKPAKPAPEKKEEQRKIAAPKNEEAEKPEVPKADVAKIVQVLQAEVVQQLEKVKLKDGSKAEYAPRDRVANNVAFRTGKDKKTIEKVIDRQLTIGELEKIDVDGTTFIRLT